MKEQNGKFSRKKGTKNSRQEKLQSLKCMFYQMGLNSKLRKQKEESIYIYINKLIELVKSEEHGEKRLKNLKLRNVKQYESV